MKERNLLRKISLGLIVILVAACYVVPYGMLGDVTSWKGAFLFWTIAGVLVIGFNAVAMAGLKDGER